jgi:hypothetical protein
MLVTPVSPVGCVLVLVEYVVPPSPNCPCEPVPQQRTVASVKRTHAPYPEALTLLTAERPDGVIGVEELVVVPFPSPIITFQPQQRIVASDFTAHT